MSGNGVYDAVVVGAGPNGLAAAITIARQGRSVLLIEGEGTVGGGVRTQELLIPGCRHDVCSAIHPLAVAAPFFRTLDLTAHGLRWIHPPAPLAHPLDDGSAVMLERSLDDTAAALGPDAERYRSLHGRFVENAGEIVEELLKPLGMPKNPVALLRFGLRAMRSADALARQWFRGERARAIFAGNAAHAIFPLQHGSSAAFGLMLSMLGHTSGWPIPAGGSQAIAEALASLLRSLGGVIQTGRPISAMRELPKSRAVLFDITPRQLARIEGISFPARYRRRLELHRHGAGVFKLDYVLNAPVPWKALECSRAGAVHIGGSLDEIAAAELQVWNGIPPKRPFVLLAQPSLFDPSRAPAGKHILWAYCHVPNGCAADMTIPIESQIERFAPGFRDCVAARKTFSPAEMEAYNPNYIGGDIAGGIQSFRELFVFPLGRLKAYSTPAKGVYICSSSMPPGGGVHGMCGHLAALRVLQDDLK